MLSIALRRRYGYSRISNQRSSEANVHDDECALVVFHEVKGLAVAAGTSGSSMRSSVAEGGF